MAKQREPFIISAKGTFFMTETEDYSHVKVVRKIIPNKIHI